MVSEVSTKDYGWNDFQSAVVQAKKSINGGKQHREHRGIGNGHVRGGIRQCDEVTGFHIRPTQNEVARVVDVLTEIPAPVLPRPDGSVINHRQ